MSNSITTVTNEDLMGIMRDVMQITSEGFERLDTRMGGLESRMDSLENRMDTIEQRLVIIEQKLHEHTLQLAELHEMVIDLQNKYTAYINDITDILDRIQVLENRKPEITRAEFNELQELLQAVVEWAIKAAHTSAAKLNLPE